jgi:hypothetical protein
VPIVFNFSNDGRPVAVVVVVDDDDDDDDDDKLVCRDVWN